jgi:hypothetical protein
MNLKRAEALPVYYISDCPALKDRVNQNVMWQTSEMNCPSGRRQKLIYLFPKEWDGEIHTMRINSLLISFKKYVE